MKHTKAPWEIYLNKPTGHTGIMIFKNDTSIANVYLNMTDSKWGKENPIHRVENKEAKANASLISAAPELLEACEMQLKIIDDMMRFIGPIMPLKHYELMNDAFLAASKAIEKAKK